MYPELYRKTKNIKGSNEESKPPFDIGIIKEVLYSFLIASLVLFGRKDYTSEAEKKNLI